MTREVAIKGLKVLRKDFSGYKPNEEMFNIAIKALENQKTLQEELEKIKEEFEDKILLNQTVAVQIIDKKIAELKGEQK